MQILQIIALSCICLNAHILSAEEQEDIDIIDESQDVTDSSDNSNQEMISSLEKTLIQIINSLEKEEKNNDIDSRSLSFITKTIANYKTLLYHVRDLARYPEEIEITYGYIELCINDIDFLFSENNIVGLSDDVYQTIQKCIGANINIGNYYGSIVHILSQIINDYKSKNSES